jgi:iron complex outermembrane receptor protein
MRSRDRIQWLVATLLGLDVVLGAPALAADAPAADEAAAPGLEEVVVTARKRAERAQETPISLSVATGEDLRNRSVTQFIELQNETPALHIVPAALSGTTTNLSMRGQALVDIRLSVDPTVAIYQDGIYLPRAQGSNAADLLDVERVEVLAGPQGTLFGKNSTGGALNVFTKTPTNQLEGFVRGRYGNYSQWNAAAMVNIPLTDTLALRAVGSFSGQDGWGANLGDGTFNGKMHSSYERLGLKWAPTDNFSVLLRGDYTINGNNRAGWKGPLILFPPLPSSATALGGPLATTQIAMEQHGIPNALAWLGLPTATRDAYLAQADAAYRSYASGDPSTSDQDLHSGEHVAIRGGSAELNYQLTDEIGVKSLTGYRTFSRQGSGDLDGSPFHILEYPYMRTDDSQFSEELQLSGNFLDNRLSSLAGFYYSNERGQEETDQSAIPLISGINSLTKQIARVGTRSLGVYTQHTYKITDELSFTGGLRWTEDYRYLTASNYNATRCTALGVPLASIGGIAGCNRPMSASFNKVNYTAGFEYKITQDAMAYFTTRRGYRAGGLQQTGSGNDPVTANAAFVPYRPETVTDYELGIKSEWFDRKLRANVAIYHSLLQNAIRNVSYPVIQGTTTTVAVLTQNAASAIVNGTEFELTYRPITSVQLGLNGSYIQDYFSKYVTPLGVNQSYLPLLFTPKWQVNGSAAYTATTPIGSLRTSVDYDWTSKMLTAETLGYSPKHGLLNGRMSLQLNSDDLEIALWGKNLTNKRYPLYPVDISGGAGSAGFGFVYQGYFNDPRTYGVEVTQRF